MVKERTKLHLFLNLLIQENGIILISTKGKAMTDDFRNISMNSDTLIQIHKNLGLEENNVLLLLIFLLTRGFFGGEDCIG